MAQPVAGTQFPAAQQLDQKGTLTSSFSNLSLMDSGKNAPVPPEWPTLLKDYFESKTTDGTIDQTKTLRAIGDILKEKDVDHLIEPLCTSAHVQTLMRSLHGGCQQERVEAFRVISMMTSVKKDEYLFELFVASGLLGDVFTLLRWNVHIDLMMRGCIIIYNFSCRIKYKELLLPIIPTLKLFTVNENSKVRTEAFFALFACTKFLSDPERTENYCYVLEKGVFLLSPEHYLELKTCLVDIAKSNPSVERMMSGHQKLTTPAVLQQALAKPFATVVTPISTSASSSSSMMNDG